MAPINIKEIIRVSSEDEKYSASNLTKGQKWMCCNKNQNDEASIEFLFEKPSQIHYIDIGYCNVASIQIEVGLQTWPQYKEMLAILPQMITQTCIEARMGKNKSGCKMFNHEDHLNPDVTKQFWDKIKVTLRQPYNKNKQFGLEFIRFGTPLNAETKPNNTPQEKTTKETEHPSTPQNLHLIKLMEKIRQRNTPPQVNSTLEKKLKILSGSGHAESDESALNRTAKMVLASKMKSPNINGFQPPTCNQKNSPKNVNLSVIKTPVKSFKQQKEFPSSRKSQSPSTSQQNPTRHSNSDQEIFTPPKAKFSQMNQKQVNTDTQKPKTSKVSVTQSKNFPPNMADKSSDCEIIESPCVQTKSVYTEKQIKQLKKAIKRFYNSLDMDNFNPNEVKFKDLRQKFEQKNEMKLNKEGRKYFREITTAFVNIVAENKQIKQTGNIPGVSAKRKLQNGGKQSPAKVRKPSEVHQHMLVDPSVEMIACPICTELFPGSTIEVHAASCGDNSIYEPISSNYQHHSNVNTVNSFNQMNGISDGHIDRSENSSLTPEEQLKWIQFSKQPKPYQERLNRSDFEGCKLARCPSCGQSYKSTEIQLHSDECAEKVNCGLTKMGLYYVDQKKKIVKPKKSKCPIVIEIDD